MCFSTSVYGSDGVKWCGVFCAGYNAVEQLTLDDEVDMFNIVRLMRVRRPELVPSFVSTCLLFSRAVDFRDKNTLFK